MELTDEQRAKIEALPPLARRVLLERVADATASDVECYRRAGGKAKTDNTASVSVSEILANPKVSKILDTFKKPVIDDSIATREELLRDLTNVTRVSVTDVMSWTTCVGTMIDSQTGDESNYPSIITVRNMDEVEPWVLKCVKSVEQTKSGMIKLTMEDRSTARKLLIDMQGFNAPTESHVTVTKTLDDFYGDA